MSENPESDRPRSRLVNLAQRVAPVVADCSDCESDVPLDPRPGSRLVNLARRVPPVEVDCSERAPPEAEWVEVRVEDAAAPRLVAAAPALKLVHDPGRSRADAGGVVVAFTPADPAATREQLAALIPAIRAALGPGVVADVRVCPAA
jgi:hypothetical protein